MVALVLSLVYRQIEGLSEATRVLREEGFLWVKPMEVTRQAVSKRLINFPSEVFGILLQKVLEKKAECPQELKIGEKEEKVREKFSAVWIADGSTLEQLRKRLKVVQEKKVELGGKIMMIVEAFTKDPITVWYQEDAKSNDKKWVEMVFRSLYYVAKAILRGENPDVVSYLAERAKLFGLVKADRKRHREKDAQSLQIWQAIPLS
jgi:hypothetical protein